MEKNKIQKLIYIFLILQPIIDLITALMTRLLNSTITVGVITRGLFLLFLVVYNVFFVKNKHSKKSNCIFYKYILVYGNVFYIEARYV